MAVFRSKNNGWRGVRLPGIVAQRGGGVSGAGGRLPRARRQIVCPNVLLHQFIA
jgi:hypothetical protein